MTSKWLRFDLLPRRPGFKTDTVIVYAVKSGAQLGAIVWYNPFRKYVFGPVTDTVYDADCIADIEAKLREMMAARGK